jgi:hypothetical protein
MGACAEPVCAVLLREPQTHTHPGTRAETGFLAAPYLRAGDSAERIIARIRVRARGGSTSQRVVSGPARSSKSA